ncbi:hypothetical protein JDV02_008292 [Purpureocillium takamizusanense]|uniref:Uncharacterized protein n=1 Tax=Purpureocillium takamizusanense TaxID=2060973 RepID=A0A9Q8VEK2_9HYPO|nr:uncharacterized protein JDV02_008292 [Purpureocillium takamizusanense]UNI22401.1 hypothetical protein JDV02_008292 [Purpureocillium takamizusanense]
MGLRAGTASQGYSYATLAACIAKADRGAERRNSRSQALTDSRRVSLDSVARARVGRRYSRDSPPPRFRAETGPPSAYTSLPSGLTVPKGIVSGSSKDRRLDAQSKAKGHHTASHQATGSKPLRHRAKREHEPRKRATDRSRRRKSTSKRSVDRQQQRRPFSLSSAQSKDTGQSSVKAKKQPQQSSKGKSKED